MAEVNGESMLPTTGQHDIGELIDLLRRQYGMHTVRAMTIDELKTYVNDQIGRGQEALNMYAKVYEELDGDEGTIENALAYLVVVEGHYGGNAPIQGSASSTYDAVTSLIHHIKDD